jgi:hypothetical protein
MISAQGIDPAVLMPFLAYLRIETCKRLLLHWSPSAHKAADSMPLSSLIAIHFVDRALCPRWLLLSHRPRPEPSEIFCPLITG